MALMHAGNILKASSATGPRSHVVSRATARHLSTLTFRHRVSQSFVPTSKQKFVYVPGQEMVPSQQLLLRAEDEMENIGCQKLSLPNLLTAEKWKTTGRWESTGHEMFKVKDRKGTDFLLAPTHEEEITALIAKEVQSYRQLPVRVYQIGRKFRDELRARSGLLRGKEFLMKDLYTFDVTEEDAFRTYDEVVLAYRRIMKRLGVPYAVAEADTGNIGGTHSHEFHILSNVGEDSLLSCASCGYTSNKERAIGVIPTASTKAAESFRNSDLVPKWIESLDVVPRSVVQLQPKVQFGIMKTPSENETQPEICTLVAVATSGDRDVNETKATKTIGKIQFADSLEDVKSLLGGNKLDKMVLCVDVSLYPGQTPVRSRDVDIQGALPEAISSIIRSKDSKPSLRVFYGDYHNCKPGDGCPHCFKSKGSHELMKMTRAIEIGHTFMLGNKYSQPLGAMFVPETTQTPEPMQMGCYGLGITRLLAAIIEASHDHKGIIWPDSVAPFRVVIVTSEDEGCINAAENVYDVVQKALNAKSEVIIDDRTDVTLGYKMKDAELIGYPWMVIIGKGYLRTGNMEVQHRKTGEKWLLESPKMHSFFQERTV
ncbi:hypothetical protein BGZ65_006400 [Modicella reniformis]|uniref:proline--tRNA ligase n=1 Tax=Modicella reniformis TaxID=1440133 RepID=A0A9P6M1R3_9FUNG|nr:hypothetical protein BGZ65_006400 [Modicella reniformis]